MKRCADRLIAILLLVVITPLLALIALLIRLDSPGPALYVPPMVGKGGRLFALLRFRTMSVAEDRRGQLTRVGRVIRELSLDHLPGLLNVAWGDLALVGPRPMEPERVDLRDPLWQQYVQLRPGFFNPAALALGREWNASRTTRPTLNQRLELAYAARRSAREDWRLIRRTLRAWLASSGNIKARKPPEPDLLP
jgi:lipopolysaccharide/colanic/teichoic acid biosynthesis glycosyltransferase